MGTVGSNYPGFFAVGDTGRLTALLAKAETDPRFYALLKKTCRRLAPLVKPSREIKDWKRMLRELDRF